MYQTNPLYDQSTQLTFPSKDFMMNVNEHPSICFQLLDAIGLLFFSNRPLALAAIFDETCTQEELPLAESRVYRVHVFIVFFIKDGGP